MANIEAVTIPFLIMNFFFNGTHAILLPTLGNWTWDEAILQCRDKNSRLAYFDEITSGISISNEEIREDDVRLWINDGTLRAECEHPRECPLMFGDNSRFKYNATCVNCTMKAGTMCRTDVVKHVYGMNGMKFIRSKAQTLCLNTSSQLIDLSSTSDLERKRSVNVDNSHHYWTSGVIKHGKTGVFQIVDCVHSSGLSDQMQLHNKKTWNSVYICQQLCRNSTSIALMNDQCGCLLPSQNVTDRRTSGCTTPCVGSPRDRCGGNDSFSIYRQIDTDTEQYSDKCLVITKNSDNNYTEHWQECRQRQDGCICRNGTIDFSYVIIQRNSTWEEAQRACEVHDMMLATYETSNISESEWSKLREGATLWTGIYSPTVLEFSPDADPQSDDTCLTVTNFKEHQYDIEEADCDQRLEALCYNDVTDYRTTVSMTTLPYEDSDYMTSKKKKPNVTSTHSSVIAVTTSSPYTGMSPMIIGLISTVVFVALVLTVILGVLAVLLYRFKEQKRQLNMLKGPTISYSNLEHSVVVSHKDGPSDEDSGGDLGNLDNITEQMDALFVRKDEMSPDEKSEHLYDISENDHNKTHMKQENGIGLNAQQKKTETGGEYTEVDICDETGYPKMGQDSESGAFRNSLSSGEDKNMEMSLKCKNELRKPSLKESDTSMESVIEDKGDKSIDVDIDDNYDHTESYIRRQRKKADNDTYDKLGSNSFKRHRSKSECLYDRVDNVNYDEVGIGVDAKPKIYYEDIDLDFDRP
ncbi:uncharacterized protein LOC132555231 [Ylistrum balloti]|uniref:uncharacterized protein LOC132555231 n=1 Tax=Ylistrum balloti TaxID=509963 RepID=UPI002905D18B|nr:uncharacterized protein LOC132555231 [Ylistrum balloti]